jgi:diguanylate cyclase (GGDEF)-like protein
MLRIILRAFLGTLLLGVMGLSISFTIRWALGKPFSAFAMGMNMFMPLVTTLPFAVLFFWEHEKLRRMHADLTAAHARLRAHSSIDPLTGALMREAFFEQMAAAREGGRPGAMMIIDADHFKSINDTYGHTAGDEALKLLSNAIRRQVRKNDIFGRVGGEEFGVFLPETSTEEALLIAERIRASVQSVNFEAKPNVVRKLTVSVGLTGARAIQTRSELFAAADACLYAAKNSGRNRVVMREPFVLQAEYN